MSPPRVIVNRYRTVSSARPKSKPKNPVRLSDENVWPSAETPPRMYRVWSQDAINEAIKPVHKSIKHLNRAMNEGRREILNRISLLEDDVRNLSSVVARDLNANKRFPNGAGYRSNTVSLENIHEMSNSIRENFPYSTSADVDMSYVKRLELQLMNKSYNYYSSSNEELSKRTSTDSVEIMQSDEMDKTGFQQIRARAVRKAALCQPFLSGQVTLGPTATHNGWSGAGSTPLGGSLQDLVLPITPIAKPKPAKTMKDVKVRLIVDEPMVVDEDKLCQRRILAELNKLSSREAQEAKYLHMKQWEEHDKRADEVVAQRSAQQQAEALARQHAKMMEMALQHEEFMKRQQELAATQAHREIEFSRRQEETRKQQLEAEKQLREKMNKQAENFQKVYEAHRSFSNMYREILEMLKAQEDLKFAFPNDLEVIKNCQERFNGLIAKCKHDQINDDDVRNAQDFVDTVSTFNMKAKTEMANILSAKKKDQEELDNLRKLEEEKNRKKLEEENKLLDEKRRADGDFSGFSEAKSLQLGESDRQGVISSCCRFQEYKALLTNLEKVEETLIQFSKDETLKKFRSDCQKAINVPVNAISAHSASHLFDKYKKLLNFLQRQTVIVSEKRITATLHPLGPLYSLNYLAIKTVKQGEQCVSSNPEAAYPIAAVVVALWSELPEYGKLLLSQFYKASPYLIPAYWVQREGEDENDYYKRLGFLYSNGEKEDMDKFLKRQSGIMRLYCAIIITPHSHSNKSKPHPLPVSQAWEWLTAFICLPPKADISATMLLEMLEVTGHLMMSTYQAQFRKLLHLVCISYLPLIEKVTPAGRGGPVTRLRSFLEGLISGQSIPPPKGLLPPNFW